MAKRKNLYLKANSISNKVTNKSNPSNGGLYNNSIDIFKIYATLLKHNKNN